MYTNGIAFAMIVSQKNDCLSRLRCFLGLTILVLELLHLCSLRELLQLLRLKLLAIDFRGRITIEALELALEVHPKTAPATALATSRDDNRIVASPEDLCLIWSHFESTAVLSFEPLEEPNQNCMIVPISRTSAPTTIPRPAISSRFIVSPPRISNQT